MLGAVSVPGSVCVFAFNPHDSGRGKDCINHSSEMQNQSTEKVSDFSGAYKRGELRFEVREAVPQPELLTSRPQTD